MKNKNIFKKLVLLTALLSSGVFTLACANPQVKESVAETEIVSEEIELATKETASEEKLQPTSKPQEIVKETSKDLLAEEMQTPEVEKENLVLPEGITAELVDKTVDEEEVVQEQSPQAAPQIKHVQEEPLTEESNIISNLGQVNSTRYSVIFDKTTKTIYYNPIGQHANDIESIILGTSSPYLIDLWFYQLDLLAQDSQYIFEQLGSGYTIVMTKPSDGSNIMSYKDGINTYDQVRAQTEQVEGNTLYQNRGY